MKRLPLLPTLFVAFAVATMIGLGVWQINRAAWKDALLEGYAAADAKPPIAFPAVPVPDENLLYRRASGLCLEVVRWTARAGRSVSGQSGWRHVALCRTGGGEGPGMAVDLGWSRSADAPKGYAGGPVAGVMDFDRDHVFLLVADAPAPGLEASERPSPAAIPNNHRAYAMQWFLFAGAALVIYALALRRRKVRV
jgi:surfeit locus 1 family protein